jgi:SAM-dependent methyltransferase
MSNRHDGEDAGKASGDARAFFGRHARAYAASPSHRDGPDLAMVVEALMPLAGREALDVATGAGFAALAMARAGASVTAVDVTPEMLAETRRLLADEGFEARLVLADTAALPFAAGSFDRVVSRRAAHHFAAIDAALGEWRRVLRVGGIACVADMAPPLAAAAWQNALERARDASHRRALAPDEWRRALLDAGFAEVQVETWRERQTLSRWLYPVADDALRRHAEAAFATAPAAVAAALAFRREADGEWSFDKQRIVARAVRPPGD